MDNHIIVLGNPVDGFTFTGPFPTKDEAEDYGEWKFAFKEWWVLELDEPEWEGNDGGTNAAD